MGYAKLRQRQANGSFQSRVLKPANKNSHVILWGGALMLLLVAVVVMVFFYLPREGCATDSEAIEQLPSTTDKIHPTIEHFVADEKDTDVQENVYTEQGSDSKLSSMALDLGDYSNLQDARFCRRHGLDVTKVNTDYDVHRRANVRRYAPEAQYIKMPLVSLRMIVQYVECSNRIVEKTEIYVMYAKGEKGTAEFQHGTRAMATVVVDELSELSTLSSEGNPIVASSPNIMYRGYNKRCVEDSLTGAVSDVIKNHCGVVAIQWKTPKCFVSWHFLAMNGVYTVIKSRSDQIIRTNVFGNE